jgi:hypothetical protein
MAITLVHENVVFEDQVVYLAGNTFFDCTFRRCTLLIRETVGSAFVNCTFDGCIWHLDILVCDHEYWKAFLEQVAPMITKSLPHAPDEKRQ